MEGFLPRQQRSSSFDFSFEEHLADLTDESWKMLDTAQPTHAHAFGLHSLNGAFSHDDSCAYNRMCYATDVAGNNVGTMLSRATGAPGTGFHTRGYDTGPGMPSGAPSGLSGHDYMSNGSGFAASFAGMPMDSFENGLQSDRSRTSLSLYGTPDQGAYSHDISNDFATLLSSQQPREPEGSAYDCGSDCCDGDACADDPSACDDETCQKPRIVPLETAAAAEALTSIGGRAADVPTSQMPGQPLSTFSEVNTAESHHAPCFPDFLPNYVHLLNAHDPRQPSCTDSVCPVDDPNFYNQCHMPYQSYFDDIDMDELMDASFSTAECGAKLPDGEAMVHHFFSQHQPGPLTLHSILPHGLGGVGAGVADMTPRRDSGVTSGSAAQAESNFKFHGSASPSPALCTPRDQSNTMPQHQSSTLALRSASTSDKAKQCMWCSAPDSAPCGKVFETAEELARHVRKAHTHSLEKDDEDVFSCGWAGCHRRGGGEKGGFRQKSKIERHMQVHTGEKNHVCHICNNAFSAKQALEQHLLIHDESKPHKCPECPKTFRQPSALTMHIRTHTKEKPLRCPVCGMAFGESSNLSKHKRIHEETPKYACTHPGCLKRFRRKDQLRRHMEHHAKGSGAAASASPVSCADEGGSLSPPAGETVAV